jgi:hypothetical protein
MARNRETTNAGVLGDWRRLLEPLKENAADLAHLEVPRAKLEALWANAVQINQEQAARTAAKQDFTKQLQEMVTEGKRLSNLLRSAVKEHYGIRSEKLAEFGLQPFRGRTKAKPAPEGPGAPGSPQPPPVIPPTPHAAQEAPIEPGR